MSKAEMLRKLFMGKNLIRIVGAHNGLTAKLVESAGFDGIWASSLEVSASHAVPDANILTMQDYLDAAIDMNEAVSIPVVVDVDQGYGNSTNVIHMVKKFETAGIAGIIMEDKLFPKQNSLLAGGRQELATIGEFVGKIMAAKNAQESKDFMVIARIEALIAGWGQEEAMKRAKAYVNAGVDGIMIHSKKNNPDEITEFIKNFDLNVPIVVVPSTYPSFTEEKIKSFPKIRMVIYANHVIRSAVTSIKETLKEIKDAGGIDTVSRKIIPVEELFELQGTSEMKENEKKFLFKQEKITALVPAAGVIKEPSLKPLLQDTPLVMLDVNGKSILQRNVELLKSLGIKDIFVVSGPNSDKINIEGINIIQNKNFENSHILYSIMCAEEKLNGKLLLVYSDILFEKEIIEKLLKSEEDITLVIDGSFKNSKIRQSKKEEHDLVLVKAKHDPVEGERIIRPKRDNPVLKIGKKIGVEEANYEYIGLALFSEKGIEDLKKAYEEEKTTYSEGLFNEAVNFDMANLHDILMRMIQKGYKVSSMEIDKGWSEIHTFEDYKRVSRMIAD
ncbi:phosphoenolpyruvate mutase [Candidatus Woesearchaeota archaeon]|nr:phosphoenolpyruvate mutase [Candidatus Woesearchaeota archaeon]|tara:strand:+ start:15916 stop:17592 length:1677 start_codon:yes stop_codon:yes gene_type:complete